jgi:hypothetical protein
MERRTVRGFYDDGELRFSEPVDLDGCWKLEITFVEEVDDEGIPLEANPHSPEMAPMPERFEDLHRQITDPRATNNPLY